MKHMPSTSPRFDFDVAQRGDALELLQSLLDCSATIVVFDPQHRSVLDHLKFGNEGARQIGRAALPAMSEAYIDLCIREIARILIPSGYLFLWADTYQIGVGSHLRVADAIRCVDVIAWDSICAWGWASARAGAAIMCSSLQKPPSHREDLDRPCDSVRAGPRRSIAKFTRTSSPRN